MAFGTWTAKRVIQRVHRVTFERYVSTLLLVISVYMAVHG